MPLPTKSLDQITEADLLALIQAGEVESKVIEYKEMLPGNADSDMYVGEQRISAMGAHAIDRDHLLMPEILLEYFDCNLDDLLKPTFDAIYNACGYAES